MNQKLPLIFFGAGHYVVSLIQTLHEHFALRLVITTEKNNTDPVPEYCTGHNIPYISVKTSDQLLDTKYQILNTESPVAILASFGLIIPEEIIDIFPKGIVNIHPSYLPYYRGATPIQSAIAHGDTETAVSLMVIDQELDHGPLLSQLPLEISPEDTSESLYTKAFQIGAEKLLDILPAYVAGNIEPREQDHTKATYTPKQLTKQDSFIDIEQIQKMSSLEIENWKLKIARLVRAYYPWPGVWTKVKINGQEKILKLLPNNMFQVEGKKPVSKKDLLNGYPELQEVIEKITI